MSEYKKCESNGKRYATYICDFLKEDLQVGANPKVKGFVGNKKIMLADMSDLGTEVAYQKPGRARMLLNFCPYCGGNLHSIGEDE